MWGVFEMRKLIVFPIALLLCQAGALSAGLLYPVSVNTSSIAGTTGSLDFQFEPGPLVSQAASVEILSFVTNGTLIGAPSTIGDVAGGPLSSALSFDNATQLNDYFQEFRFGTTLSFSVLLDGPAVNSPDGTSTSGSEFGFSMFSDAAGTVPALTTDTVNGFAVTLAIGLNGTVGVTDNSAQTLVGAPIVTPEPNSAALGALLVGLGGVAGVWRRKTQIRCERFVQADPGRVL
jgi:hypothetical protein